MNNCSQTSVTYSEEDIAVIGMAGRFPEAKDLEEFWSNLAIGRDSVRDFPDSRIVELKAILGEELSQINFIRQGYLEQISLFEPEIFGIHHEECRYMDPQQRILLELVEEAILDAGYDPVHLAGREVGIFVAENENMYTRNFNSLSFMAFVNGLQSASSGRIAYTYNFRGPAFVIGSACSSTLVAVHTACESLRRGDCEYAVSGGVRLDLFPTDQSQIASVPILSPDQKAKAFDRDANGTIIGEGGAVLVLKPVKKALEDGDNIHAIIKAGCVNSDGSRSSSLNSPSEEGQAEAIIKAVQRAKIDPLSISYLETHGTGTKIGDPIEIAGITNALRHLGFPYQSVPIGSLKTNIGHLDIAAGVGGLVKTILALKYKQIPASLHFKAPNPFIDFAESPVYVNDRLSRWEARTPRRAGVTSLGLTGTNAHMILEEAPVLERSSEWSNIITIRARTEQSLKELTEKLLRYLQNQSDLGITDIAYTLNTGRRQYPHAIALTADSTENLVKQLASGEYTRYTSSGTGTYFETVHGQVVEKEEQAHFASILIYPDYSEELFASVNQVFQTQPLKAYLDEVLTMVEDPAVVIDHRVQHVLNLYAYTRLLTDHGINSGAVLGFGLGELVADLVLGDITLSTCVKQALSFDRPAESLQEERLAQIVSSIIAAGYTSFLLLTPSTSLIQHFQNVLCEKEGVTLYPFLAVVGGLQRTLIELLQAGVKITWRMAYRLHQKRRVSLPGYVFDRKPYFLQIPNYQNGITAPTNAVGSGNTGEVFDPVYIENQIKQYLKEFDSEALTNLDLDFDLLGMDSIALMHFKGKVKQEFGVNIPLTLFFQDLSIGETLEEVLQQILENTRGEYFISKQPLDTDLPMAHAQQVLFKMAQLNAWGGHIARAWKVKGGVDKEKLEKAFQTIVERHESLRTSFQMTEGKLVQRVHAKVDFRVNYCKISPWGVKRKVYQQVKPFDLGKPPLLRVTVLEAGRTAYLLYEVPYIIVDATSLHLLVEEFLTLYGGGQLPELRIHQKDFVVWQEKHLDSVEMRAKVQYWHELFRDGIHEINLPADFPRPQVFDGSGERQEYWIRKKLTDQLNRFALVQGVTMNMVLLAAYNILLSKYTGVEDVTIGILMGGRANAELERLIGHFAFILPLRNAPVGEKTFIQFLAEVRDHSVKAFENQEYPIELLMESLQIQRGTERGPWFDSTFTYHNLTGQQALPDTGLQLRPHRLDFWTVVEDFIIILMETDRGIMMDLRYSTQLFKKSTIHRFKNDYIRILKQVVANPQIPIDDIQLQSSANPLFSK